MKKILTFINLIVVLATISSCKKKNDPAPTDPVNSNESELITTVMLIIGSGDADTVYFRDLDGDGGNAPTIDNIRLYENRSYPCRVVLLDETKTPADTISNEVSEEAEEHQFFYTVSNALPLTVSYEEEDVDANGVPIGLSPLLETTATGTGSLTIVLKHQGEDKPTSGQGDAAIGDTDVEVTFPVEILTVE